MKKVRTRFAPSPTGFMHVGGVRTALFAWLTAKQADGDFILRIEDTDRAREIEGSVQHIIDSLDWLGLERQEGPVAGGEFGPYLQSERLEVYKEWAQKLYDEGKAYADPYTTEEIQAFREQAQAEKRPFLYRRHRPENPPAWNGKQPLRLKVEVSEDERVEWHDEVRGDLSAGADSLDDFILLKADGYPTYNFAHIVDDMLMEITHVVRGEEFLSSMPKYLKLYEALGIEPPQFITTPPILNPNGGKKLSKRDGAKDILDYGKIGYSPEVMLNYLASLGWNDGSEQEVFTNEELLEKFTVERIQTNGAKWDDERLNWISGHHIRRLGVDELYQQIDADFWPAAAADYDDDYKKQVLALNQERLKFYSELPMLSGFFFAEPDYETKLLLVKGAREPDQVRPLLEHMLTVFAESDFTETDLESRTRQAVEDLKTKPKILFSVLRHAVCGQTVAPGLFETMELIGKDKVLARLEVALKKLV